MNIKNEDRRTVNGTAGVRKPDKGTDRGPADANPAYGVCNGIPKGITDGVTEKAFAYTGRSESERVMLRLHDLYRTYGYTRYKMNKFEEYELYLRHREFLETDSIITFNDADGRLLALKPDLTLSIVKNYNYSEGYVQKLFYSENVYRSVRPSRVHKEIMQTGLECLGDTDTTVLSEVSMLAAASLGEISDDFILLLSHMGVIEDLLSRAGNEETRKAMLRSAGEKNLHDLRRTGEEGGVPDEIIRALEKLISFSGTYAEGAEELGRLPLTGAGRKALDELCQVAAVLNDIGYGQNIRLDFSIVNSMKYYSGLLFRGYVRGIPGSVLSGGQYDRLMAAMERRGGALGFAVYLDELDSPESNDGSGGTESNELRFDADCLLLYSEEDDPRRVIERVRAITAGGETVLAEKKVPDRIRTRRVEIF